MIRWTDDRAPELELEGDETLREKIRLELILELGLDDEDTVDF